MNRIDIALLLVLLPAANASCLTIRAHRYGGTPYDAFVGIALTPNGVALAGHSLATALSVWPDLYVERVDSNGVSGWAHLLNYNFSDEPKGIIAAPGGGFLVYGASCDRLDGNSSALAVLINGAGDVVWRREAGRDGDDSFAAAMVDGNGFLLAGHSRPVPFEKADMFLVRLDDQGTVEWTFFYGGPDDDLCTFAVRGTDGNILMGGRTRADGTVSADLQLYLLDGNGTVLNSTHQVTELATVATAAAVMDNGYVVTGTTFVDSTLEQPRPFLVYVNNNGNASAMSVLQDGDPFWVKALAAAPGGYLLFGGQSYFGDQGLIRVTTLNGEFVYQAQDTQPGWDCVNAIAYDTARQRLYFAGESCPSEDDDYNFIWGYIQREAVDFPIPQEQQNPGAGELAVYPNPFNAASTIRLTLERNSTLRLVIYDVLGREALRIMDAQASTGNHYYLVNAENLASGMYFLKTEINGIAQPMQKLMLIR